MTPNISSKLDLSLFPTLIIIIMNKLLVLAFLLSAVLALEGVVELTDQNFNELVYSEPKLWLVMFSASWVHLSSISAATVLTSNLRSKNWLLC